MRQRIAQHLRPFLTFTGVGLGATVVQSLLLLSMVEVASWPPMVANVLGSAIIIQAQFIVHSRFTFRDKNNSRKGSEPATIWKRWRQYIFSRIIGSSAHQAMFFVAVEVMHWDYRWSSLVIVSAIGVYNYRRAKKILGSPTAVPANS